MWCADTLPHNLLQTPLGEALTLSFGPLSSVHIKPSQKKRREVSVIASFEHGVHAWRAVTEGSDLRCSHILLQDCWIGWWDPSTGKAATHPPARVQAWIQGGVSARDAPVETRTPHDAADEFDYEYEASTLARLRQVKLICRIMWRSCFHGRIAGGHTTLDPCLNSSWRMCSGLARRRIPPPNPAVLQ